MCCRTEAAATLGISLPTLYAYVSRGMLSSSPDAQGKHRLYDAAEVRRLARRKADGKRAGKVAQKVLDWGVPVLESSISTAIPAAERRRRPSPATIGLGSFIAATTLETPAAISASAQGPVRPVCEQGSSET